MYSCVVSSGQLFFYFIDSPLALFEELHEIDKNWISLLSKLLPALRENSKFQKLQNDGELDNVSIAGSTYEGAMVARVFTPSNGSISREIETDVEFTLLSIPESYKGIVEDIPQKKGFARVCITDDLLWKFSIASNWDVYKRHFEERRYKICKSGYFKPNVMKETLSSNLDINKSPKTRLRVATFLSASTEERITFKFNTPTITKATVQDNFDVYVNEKLILKVAWDFSTLIRINWWPEVANEWIFRERKWPKKSVINDLTKTSYLITKSSVDPSSENDTSELQYSFAHLERELVSRRSSDQGYLYLIFKSIFYKWIKPIDPDAISSFIVKTVMFWVCEEYCPNHRIWRKKSCVRTLNQLFCKLLSALEDRHLPYYFIPSINVIETIKDELRIKMISIVNNIVRDTWKFIPKNVGRVIEVTKEIFILGTSVNNLLNCLELVKYSVKLFIKNIETFKEIYTGKSTRQSRNYVESVGSIQYKNDQQSGNLELYTTAAFYLLIFVINLNRLCLIY